ncbi:DUF4269 domain-containing protein [Bacillus sp. V59.32b]|uniref:DUF4269 domain-containing protein n=1 Tax=Bacillus sp. V59.32b TaxID=1758642 RepID=UPI001C2010A8|nr:DUF4269 domain-containing protein [Bacillus sp. V59.32b]
MKTLDYLTLGSDKQRQAHRVINSLGIMNELSMYTPVLCGTLPIEVDVEGSDLIQGLRNEENFSFIFR